MHTTFPAVQSASAPADRHLERVGASVLFFFALAQGFQHWLYSGYPADPDPAAEMRIALSALDQARSIAVYASIFLFPLAYVAIQRRLRNGWATAGLVVGMCFVVLEMIARAFDLTVFQTWRSAWLALPEGDPSRAILLDRLQLAAAAQAALYLPLLGMRLFCELCFLVATGYAAGGPFRRDPWLRLAQLGIALSLVRLTLRFVGEHAGIGALLPLASALYLPVSLANVTLVGLWLWQPARVSIDAPTR